MSDNFIKVNLKVNGQITSVKIEKGCSFENNGCRYTVDKNGNLKIFDKKNDTTITLTEEKNKNIAMTQYQLETFKAVANNSNDNQKGIVFSKKDIDLAQQKYDNSKLRADLSETLPSGYKVERIKISKEEHSVQAYVNNGKESQSATLKFQYTNVNNTTPQKKINDDQLKPDNGNIVISNKTTSTIVDQGEGSWAIARRIVKEQLGVAPNDTTVRNIVKLLPKEFQAGDTIKVPVLTLGNTTPNKPETKPEASSSSFDKNSVFQKVLKQPTTKRTPVGANKDLELITYDYKIEKGDNLTKIAAENGTSVSDLKRDNDLNSSKIIAGETLKLNKLGYTVKKGDNLYQIAKRFGLTVDIIKDMNDIIDADEIKVGDTIQIPGFVYTVKKGDNLTKIAGEAGISVEALKSVNGLKSTTIQPGQKLVILYNDSDFGNKDIKRTIVSETETVVDMSNTVGNRKHIQQKRRVNGKVVPSRTVTDAATLKKYKGGPLTGKTIIVNAGHGYGASGTDPGTLGKGGLPNEWLLNYDNAMRLKRKLEAKGAKVIFLQGSRNLVVQEMKKDINNSHMMISVHINAADPKVPDRTQFYYYNGSQGSQTAQKNSKRLSQIAEKNFDKWVSANERVKSDAQSIGKVDRMGLLKNYYTTEKCPAIIWEVAFMTSPTGRNRLKNNTTMESYATLMTNSIVDYYKK